MKIDFNNLDTFADLEDKAIDGQLDYENYPPCEYKYFSKLAKLGYQNRHNGWSVEICKVKQNEYKKKYVEEKSKHEENIKVYVRYQSNIRLAGTLLSDVEKSKNVYDIAEFACKAIGLMVSDDSFFSRQVKKIKEVCK